MTPRMQEINFSRDSGTRVARGPKAIRGTTWQPSWGLIRIVIALMPPFLAAAGTFIDYRTTSQVIEGRLTATSSLIATYAEAALAQATTASSVLADFIARNETSETGGGSGIARLAAELVSKNLAVSGVLAIGPDGEIIVDDSVEPAEWPSDAASALLRAHWDDATRGSLVSRPYLGPTNGERQFNVSVAARGANGEPQYVVASVIVARDLMEQLSRASPYRDFTITFFDSEGNVFARHPSIGGNLDRLRVGTLPPLDSPAFTDRGYFYIGHLKFSPRLRFVNILRVSGYPVYVAYSAAYWEALGPWLQRSLIVGVTGVAAAALLFIALSQLMAASRREIDAERSMREALDRERKAEILAIRNQDRELIARMAGGVGHEFNNLMGGVLGMGELLSSPNVDGREMVAAGRQLTAVAERGGTLAHALMIYGGRGFLDFQVIDLCDLVRSAVEAFRTTVGSGIEISARLPAAPLQTRADPDKLASAIGHLLLNAVSALPDGAGRVDVMVETDRPLPPAAAALGTAHPASISVVDDGVGMSAETLARARDPFFTTRDVGQGAGLGLSMVDGLAKASNGHLEIESRPGAGTRVTMWLPLAGAIAEPRSAVPPAEPPGLE